MFAPLRAGDMVLVEIPVSGFIFCAFAYVDDVAFSDRLLVVLPRPQRHSDALTRAKGLSEAGITPRLSFLFVEQWSKVRHKNSTAVFFSAGLNVYIRLSHRLT